MMYKKLLLFIQNYLIVKKPWKSLKINDFQISAILKQSKIRINGKENLIKIEKGNFKRIKIGLDGSNNSIVIDKNTYIRNMEIIVQGNNHTVYIGKRVEVGEVSIVCCGMSSKIYLGDDCLLASNINIKSCDGHAIYQDKRVINNSQEVIIGNRVWIAQDVNILKGVSVGDDSVIGINSLVTANKYASNIILGGIPAKVIKQNINWGKERTL